MRASLALFALALATVLCWAGTAQATEARAVDGGPAEVREYWTMKRMMAAEEAQAPPAPLIGRTPGPVGAVGRPDDASSASYVPGVPAGSPPVPARMQSGEPPERTRGALGLGVDREQVTDPSAPDVRMHGKIFFTIPSGAEAGDYVCSGTAVNSRNRSVVWTAGHCVYDLESGSGYVANWLFVPGYEDESKPFGEWPAKRLATTAGYRTSANLRYDLGAAVVTQNESGQRLQDVVGARGIGFDQPRDHGYAAYGYPAKAPPAEFTGGREFRCDSDNAGSDSPVGSGPATMAIDCDMTAGASGGGWIVGNTLLSVTSYGYVIEPNHLYGPYMSTSARKLYRGVSGKKRKKKGGRGGKGGRGTKGRWTHELAR